MRRWSRRKKKQMLSHMMPASSTGSEQSRSLVMALASRQRCRHVMQQPKSLSDHPQTSNSRS